MYIYTIWTWAAGLYFSAVACKNIMIPSVLKWKPPPNICQSHLEVCLKSIQARSHGMVSIKSTECFIVLVACREDRESWKSKDTASNVISTIITLRTCARGKAIDLSVCCLSVCRPKNCQISNSKHLCMLSLVPRPFERRRKGLVHTVCEHV